MHVVTRLRKNNTASQGFRGSTAVNSITVEFVPEFELRSPVLNHALDTQGFHSEILRSLVRLTRLFITCRMEYCIAFARIHVWCRGYPRLEAQVRVREQYFADFRFEMHENWLV